MNSEFNNEYEIQLKSRKMPRNPKSEIRNDLPSLYLITDRHQTNGRPLPDVLKDALSGGVRLLQLREKDLSGRALFELAEKVKRLCDNDGARLLVNDRIDVALAVGADGVHLPANSFSPGEARELLGEKAIIGISTHSMEEALNAERGGADFITFSPIYFTPSKVDFGEPQGIEKLREVCRRINIPVYALGGIKNNNISDVIGAGAYGVAMISAIIAADDVTLETKNLMQSLMN